MARILVTGATGSQGGAVARALIPAGHSVAALVRDPSSSRAGQLERSGIELIGGDLTDTVSLSEAFAERDVVYAVTTPFADGAAGELRQGAAIVAAAEAVSVPWLILASVASAGQAAVPHFQSKAQIESRLRESPLAWTVIAPSYFFENVLGSVDGEILSLPLPPTVPLHQVSLANLGELVAAVVDRREEHLRARIEVAGDAPTPREMAAALDAGYQELPLAAIEERNPDLAAMYSFLAETGYGIDIVAVRRRYPEVRWDSFARWSRR